MQADELIGYMCALGLFLKKRKTTLCQLERDFRGGLPPGTRSCLLCAFVIFLRLSACTEQDVPPLHLCCSAESNDRA